MNLLYALIKGFWIIIPAYAANASAPLASGESRMDFGKQFLGNDIFGAGKTWRGFFAAVIMGSLTGAVEVFARPYLNPIAVQEGFSLAPLSLASVLCVALGAMLSDLIASFAKRRGGIERGGKAPPLDQLDFLLGSFAAAWFFFPIEIESVLVFLVITPLVHFLSNVIGHRLGAKDVPW